MKIVQIDVFQVDLPYSGGVYVLSGGREYRSFDATIVRIGTDTGIEGWGESTPFGSTYIGSHAHWRECMSLRRRTDVPMIWHELAISDSSIVQLIADDAAEGIGLKISKNGGLTRCRRQRDICIAAGFTISAQETTGSDTSGWPFNDANGQVYLPGPEHAAYM
jgi:L-alanine-DL-glutamate epimerase-like enolase superfamily enzyme